MGSRAPAVCGLAASVAFLAGCAETPEVIEYCVTRTDPPRVVDTYQCDYGNQGYRPDGPYTWYTQQMPARQYTYDDEGFVDEDVTPDLVMVPYGQPIYGGSFTRPPPAGATPPKVFRAPSSLRAGSTPGFSKESSGTTTIQRGGFGVARGGSSGS